MCIQLIDRATSFNRLQLNQDRTGREKEQPPLHLSYREVKTLIHNKKKAIFHCKTEGYNPNQDALHQLARHQQTIIFRLRTGHCRLNSHLKRIGVKTSAQCPCGEGDQTPEHYLQSCSFHQQARQQIWPTCVSLKTKLWGSAEDLFLTSGYAALTEKESSQRNHHIERGRRRRRQNRELLYHVRGMLFTDCFIITPWKFFGYIDTVSPAHLLEPCPRQGT